MVTRGYRRAANGRRSQGTQTKVVKTTKYNRTRITRKLAQGQHYFQRWSGPEMMTRSVSNASLGAAINLSNAGFLTLATAMAAGPCYFSWTPVFSILDVPDNAEFTTLFDRYKLLGVSIKFYPQTNVTATQLAGSAANAGLQTFMHTVTDYDDSNTFSNSITGINQMREYESYKTRRMTGVTTMSVRPKLAVALYQGAFTGYGQSRSIWVDANTNAYYYGKKIMFEVFNPDDSLHYVNIKVEVKYRFVLKDVR